MELSGKVAMISGGSKGLGAALAKRFAVEGCAPGTRRSSRAWFARSRRMEAGRWAWSRT